MFLFTEAHFWSSAKSCKRKLHSYSLVLLLLSNPLLHWGRLKTLSQRPFYQIFTRGRRGKKQHISSPQSHWGLLSSQLGTLMDLRTSAKWESSETHSQQESLLVSPKKWSQTSLKLKTRLWRMLFSANPREPLSAEGKLLSICVYLNEEQKSQFCISDRDTRTPFPACYCYSAWCQDNEESGNVWESESSLIIRKQLYLHPGISKQPTPSAPRHFISSEKIHNNPEPLPPDQILHLQTANIFKCCQYLARKHQVSLGERQTTIWKKYSMVSSDFLYILYLIHYYYPTICVWFWFSN